MEFQQTCKQTEAPKASEGANAVADVPRCFSKRAFNAPPDDLAQRLGIREAEPANAKAERGLNLKARLSSRSLKGEEAADNSR
jgi:hypothetical protein